MLRTKNYFYSILSIAFPCLLGIFAMYMNDVSSGIWLRNVSAIILLCFISVAVLKYIRTDMRLNYKIITSLCIILLVLPFFQTGNKEVHRWISISAISLNVSMLVVPVSIFAIHNLIKSKEIIFSIISILVISLILFLQPDASQLTGFTFAILLCLFSKENRQSTNILVKIITVISLIVLTVLVWRVPDTLQPVDYTEGILLMLNNVSSVLYALGILSIFLIPIPIIVFSSHNDKSLSFCIAVYYWLIILSTFFGNFPVPFMGYGISPIIGYFIMLILFTKYKEVNGEKID